MITTLWIVAIISLLALGVGFRSSLDVRLSKYNLDKLRASYLARAGILKAQESILSDASFYDSLYQCGFTLSGQEVPKDLFGNDPEQLEKGDFSVHYTYQDIADQKYLIYGPLDEERKVNINLSKTAPAVKSEYVRILKGLSPLMTEDVISAIIDWQDSDSAGDAEEDYYAFLEYPYQCKNDDFSVVEELLLVKGMTNELYEDIKEYITTYSNGKININTASEIVINALINDQQNTYTVFIEKVLQHRRGPDEVLGTADDGIFLNTGDLRLLAQESEEEQRINSLTGFLTFKSSNYRIISHADYDKVQREIECVFYKDPAQSTLKVKYYHEH